MIEYRTGNLLKNVRYGASTPDRVMVGHVCNNAGQWGAGFVVPLGKAIPIAKWSYQGLCARPLGHTQFVYYGDVTVANMIAQDNSGERVAANEWCRVDWEALDRCLIQTLLMCVSSDIPELWIPRIGTGIGGAAWEDVEGTIKGALGYPSVRDVKVVVWTLEAELSKFPQAA